MLNLKRKTVAFAMIFIMTVTFAPVVGFSCNVANADTQTASENTSESTLLLKGTGLNKSIKYSWNKVPEASKYKLYVARSGKKYSLVKTTKSLSFTKKKLNSRYMYKAYVTALNSDGKSIAKSPTVFLYTKAAKRSNAVNVSATAELNIDKGCSSCVSAKVTKKSSSKPLIKNSSIGSQIRYYSDNENIAWVDISGEVTGISPGTVNVYSMALSGAKATTKVTVNEVVKTVPLEKITIPGNITVAEKESQTLTPTFTPENATDKELKWGSSDTSVAAVTEKGTVTGVSEGKAVITAKAVNASVESSCQVTVVKEDQGDESGDQSGESGGESGGDQGDSGDQGGESGGDSGGGSGTGGESGDQGGESGGTEEQGESGGDSGTTEEVDDSKYKDTIDWMQNLPDSAPLSEVNLPGTHNTCCRYFYTKGSLLLQVTSPYAKTQCLSFPEQLKAGVRFTDIRAAVVDEDDDYLTVTHNMCITADKSDNGNPMTVDRVIEYSEAFIKAHPTETIVLGVNRDVRYYSGHEDVNEELEQALIKRFENETGKIYLETGDQLPKVGDVRGKIILIFTKNFQKLHINSELEGDVLWKLHLPYYEAAKAQDYSNYVKFSNGSTASRPYVWETCATGEVDENGDKIGLGIPDPKGNSDLYNASFLKYSLNKGYFYGWFAMDYVTDEITKKIIQTNTFK